MSFKHNPEDLYSQKTTFKNAMDGYDDDVDDLYSSSIKNVNRKQTRQTSTQSKQHIPQYQTQSMPQMSSLTSLEQDINSILEPDVRKPSSKIPVFDEEPVTGVISKNYDTSNLIANNISERKFNESIQDHYVVIDSSDRDATKYPNPFSYKVYFNTSYAANDANIHRSFDKVKSVKLESGILPTKYYYLKQDISLSIADDATVRVLTDVSRNEMFSLTSVDVSGSFAVIDVTDALSSGVYTRRVKFAEETTFPNIINKVYEYTFTFNATGTNSDELPSDPHTSSPSYPIYIQQYLLQTYNLINNKYNLLYIDELEYANEYSTNDALSKSFAVMFPDCTNNNVYYVTSKFKDKNFNFNNLGNVHKMTISIRDQNGVQLKTAYDNYVDTDVPNEKLCTCGTDANGYFVRDYRCACSYFRHPFYHHFQNTLIFKIRAFEIGIDNEIFE